jgi:hypothetical protein
MSDEDATRRRGRPRLDPHQPTVPVTVQLPAPQYDAVYTRAQRDRISVSHFIRRRLTDDDDGADD